MDTIRQTDGPLEPMVGLVPIEKDVIPMVLLVNNYASHEGDLDCFPMWPGWVQGNSDGPLVLIVLLVPIVKDVILMVPLVNKTSAVEIQACHENSSSYKPLMQNKFASTVYNQAETR